jgi:hypothetical protein
VDPRAGLGDMEKRKFLILPGLELRPIGHAARSQSLYRLRCPGSYEVRVLRGIFRPGGVITGGGENSTVISFTTCTLRYK